ncbi:hypothetical protein IGI04_040477, partial [Brassica rapa subsp. trilocularis]
MKRGFLGPSKNEPAGLCTIQGSVIPDVIAVAETNIFNLTSQWYDWGSEDLFYGLPYEDPKDLIKRLEKLASANKHDKISADHIICKIFPYCLSRDAFSWFSKLQPRSLTCSEDIKEAFIAKFFSEAVATRSKRLDKMIKDREKRIMISMSHILDFVYSKENGDIGTPTTPVKQPDIQVHHADESKQKDELNREKLVNHDTIKDDEADTKDSTSASIDSSNSESIDIRTSETIDTNICHRSIPSKIPDATTVYVRTGRSKAIKLSRIEKVDISDMSSEPIDTPTSTSIDIPTVTSIDTSFSTSIDPSLQTSIDSNSCCRSIPLEIPEKSSCPQDIADSTLKSIDVSSCYPDQKVEKEITMEDFLELEEFLELEDGQQLGDLDSSEELTMEDFLELEEWLGDLDQNSKQMFDDQHTSGKGLENSLKADDIDRHKPDEIDRHPPYNIDRHPPYDIDLQSPSNIDQHTPDCIDRRPPNCIDRHSCLDELSGYPIEPGTIEKIMHMSKTSHIDVSEHLRPHVCAEEAVGICKRVKRIYDPVKIMVPCAVLEVESPIPPDKGVYLSSYIEVLNDQHHVEADQRGLRFRDEVDKCPAEVPSSNINRTKLIDTNTSSSIDTGQIPSIDTRCESEQNEYELCRNIFYGDTTTHSDKSGEKKWRNWKKKKRINEGSQISLIPHFSDDARKSNVRLHKSVEKKERNWKKRKRTKGGSQLPLTPYFSDSVRKPRVRNKCFSHPYAKLKALLIAEMIDKGEGSSTDETISISIDNTSSTTIDCHFIVSIDTEQIVLKIQKWINLSTIGSRVDRCSTLHVDRWRSQIVGLVYFMTRSNHKLPECPWTIRNPIYVISKPLLTATLSTRFHFRCFSERREGRNSYQ